MCILRIYLKIKYVATSFAVYYLNSGNVDITNPYDRHQVKCETNTLEDNPYQEVTVPSVQLSQGVWTGGF